ncbi:MAG TPA: hypothetical protein PK765_03105 [bacterium]|nr:hypothetical protein [bacterium]
MSDALLSTREDPCQTVPNAKPAHTSPILPPLESNEAFLAVIHALRDAEVSSPDRTRSIDAIIAKTTAGTGSPRINKNGVMAIYTIASSLAETFQNPTFQQDPKEPIHSFVSNLPDMFEPGSWMRSVIASDLPRNRRETLIYGTFFIWLDRTYFRHKGARVPEPILRYLQEDHVQTQGVHFLKASLDRMGSNNDNHRNRHLELGFCLLSGDDSLEIAELVEEAKRPENQ